VNYGGIDAQDPRQRRPPVPFGQLGAMQAAPQMQAQQRAIAPPGLVQPGPMPPQMPPGMPPGGPTASGGPMPLPMPPGMGGGPQAMGGPGGGPMMGGPGGGGGLRSAPLPNGGLFNRPDPFPHRAPAPPMGGPQAMGGPGGPLGLPQLPQMGQQFKLGPAALMGQAVMAHRKMGRGGFHKPRKVPAPAY
jgi:hypothetical protein